MQNLQIKKCSKSLPPNFHHFIGIGMFIMCKNRTTHKSSYFDICNKDGYIDVLLQRISIYVSIGQLAGRATFSFRAWGSNLLGALFFLLFFLLFLLSHSNVLVHYYTHVSYLTWTCKQIAHTCRQSHFKHGADALIRVTLNSTNTLRLKQRSDVRVCQTSGPLLFLSFHVKQNSVLQASSF